jgi:aspartyl-tRNA synthetase
MVNTDMKTGEIEVKADTLRILSECRTLPFMIEERSDAREELRMKYRYLDLRSFSMQRKIKLRHDLARSVREYLYRRDFLEIETPNLIKSTPEGARDFLVPARLHPGKFYALPQSPQLFKQILMVSGFDKYFQIARCFRDEDARGDRQIEHSQIDIEMSFVSKEDVFQLMEGLMTAAFQDVLGIALSTPFPVFSFEHAMNSYGSDRPDLRFELTLADYTEAAADCGFNIFKKTAASGGSIKALVVPKGADFSRKRIDELEEEAKRYGAKGLAWMKLSENGFEGGISKFFAGAEDDMKSVLGAQHGDIIFFVADTWRTVCTALGAVRVKLGRQQLQEMPPEKAEYRFCWVTDFPLFHWDEDEEKWEAEHHMFTMPQAEYLDCLEEDPASVKGDLYDLVCNGLELASGSIRIHKPEIQRRIFNIVGFSEEEAERRFGFLLRAFEYGPPPHGGIAPGLDRLAMLMAGEDSIREVIAFPKNTLGISQMEDSPSEVDSRQLAELGIEITKKEE